MGLLHTILAALSYPKAHDFSLADTARVRALIAWVENMKIRELPVEARKELQDTSSSQWDGAFGSYLQELGCPITYSPSNLAAVVQWVLALAVSLEYKDNADRYNQDAAEAAAAAAVRHQEAAAASTSSSRAAAAAAYTDLHTQEVQAQVSALLQLLHMQPQPNASLVEQLQAIKEVLGDQILPCVQHGSESHPPDAPSTSAAGGAASVPDGAALLQDIPLGFETGDERLDLAARLLRLLYIRDLRLLQSQIDQIIVEVQEYTANPKTDSSLGRVGR